MPENFGYGQMTPFDTADEHNVMRFIIMQALGAISTMRLVKVVAIHPGDGDPPAMGTVDVQPLVNMLDGNNNATPHGTVHNIPVLRLAAGTNAFVIEPVVGDIGIMIVSDRDISNVKETKAAANPATFRKFNLSDGIYIGSILGAAPERYFQFKSDGNFKLVDAVGNVLETGPTGFVLTGNVTINGDLAFGGPGNAITGNIKMTGNLDVDGNLDAANAAIAGTMNANVVNGASGTITAMEVNTLHANATNIGLTTHTHVSGGAGNPTSAPTGGT